MGHSPRYCWHVSAGGEVILFFVPPDISLDVTPSHVAPSATSMALLPKDVLYLIIEQLHPIDRVCLGLTCKPICAAVLSSPALKHPDWMRFAEPYFIHPCISHIRFPKLYFAMPDVRPLVLRLAHGWVDKSRYLYCWKCHQIRTRDEKAWRKRMPESVQPSNRILRHLKQKLDHWWDWYDQLSATRPPRRKPAPSWSLKTLIDEATWDSWTRAQRYDHLVKTWCYIHTDDTSALACEICSDDGEGGRPISITDWHGILDGPNGSVLWDRHNQIQTVHPVECPSCLKRELTLRPQTEDDVYESWRFGRRYRGTVWANFTRAIRDFF
ncbi:hypothetical protein DV738_g2731, partial [Chaetothyriales sp. CBS 135597]